MTLNPRYFDPAQIELNGRKLEDFQEKVNPGEIKIAILGKLGQERIARDLVYLAHQIYERGSYTDFDVYAVSEVKLARFSVTAPEDPPRLKAAPRPQVRRRQKFFGDPEQ